MAGPHTYCSPRRNSFLGGKDELAESLPRVSTKDTHIFTPFPAVSQAQTLAPALALTPALPFNKELFQ